jgi:xyloglucan-specific exo-beta-1,4-glucanase
MPSRLQIISASVALFHTLCGLSASAQSYTWRNAETGGGGFVTGTVFHPTEPGLAYCRTDVGGIYRLDTATNRWLPLNDEIG